MLEISSGFISLPLRDWQRLVDEAQDAGLTVSKRMQRAAGGALSCSTAVLSTVAVRVLKDSMR